MNTIEIHNLGKKYTITHEAKGSQNYATLRDIIADSAKNLWKKAAGKKGGADGETKEEIWALKGISLDIQQGERVGIIGRNGAGKSTLLKILSRITEPTEGHAMIKGRVSSLLEVGTGFHHELTGRENIYLNGAVLGMKKAEIDKKFDEIVDFSGVEKFLDTPVKRYSSGMKVRLAFAVAAHLEPEILLIDEVLAVGDAEFQKKCLGKMDQVSKQHGRTILFVSHNLPAIESLCSRAILLEEGKITAENTDVRKVVDTYLQTGISDTISYWENPGNEFDNPYFKPVKAMICDENGISLKGPVRNDEQIYFRIEGEVRQPDRNLYIGFVLTDKQDTIIFSSQNIDENLENWPKIKKGYNILTVALPKRLLNEGQYRIKPLIQNRPSGTGEGKKVFVRPLENLLVLSFEISGGLSDSPFWIKKRRGIIAPVLHWEKYSV